MIEDSMAILKVIINEMTLCNQYYGKNCVEYFKANLINTLDAILSHTSALEKYADINSFVFDVKQVISAINADDDHMLCYVLNRRILPILNTSSQTDQTTIEASDKYLSDNIPLLGHRFANDKKSILTLSQTQQEAYQDIHEKIDSGYYRMEKIACVCGSNDFVVMALKDRYGLPVSTSLCKTCGLLQTNPRMNSEAYDEFYNKEYRGLYTEHHQSIDQFFEDQLKTGNDIYQFVQDYLPANAANILEIGCGAGGILQAFQNAGHSTIGIDLGESYLAYGREKGLELYHGHANLLVEKYEHSFDLIILNHVIEHFLDLQKELATIKKLLKSNGHIYICVPGIKNIIGYNYNYLLYFQNAHTYHFTLNTLRKVMALFGYGLVYGDEFIRCVFRTVEMNVNTDHIESDYHETINYMQTIERFFYTDS